MISVEAKQVDKFSLGFYVQTVFSIMGHPRRFFGELPPSGSMTQALGFLSLSAVFFSFARLMSTNLQNIFIVGGIHMVNAVGMVFILAGLGYVVMTLSIGKKVRFNRWFSIYALSAGVTLLVSWVPYVVIFTEPWKWWLIGTGITKGCGLKLKEALLIIMLSLTIWILFFWLLVPVIT
jgi:hypothetical protein